MGLVLNMNPKWRQKIIIEHDGEKMEIFAKQQGADTPRVKLLFVGPKSWHIYREPEAVERSSEVSR